MPWYIPGDNLDKTLLSGPSVILKNHSLGRLAFFTVNSALVILCYFVGFKLAAVLHNLDVK